ncbi:hypothetical protein I7I50_10241 [Histoplasma capsulatum G186AR]|uniref:Uncharacterized protein n=1 Tax=Ajellomyces capsulatus TaxID=5037 RepID=A0A8H8D6A1_AJECA|nr:hypothetical protein I7I52_01480 [Histoplasma capsulatum]QSS69067.1 hypothetical protein I7I50_10241 [Histoplasma capsulatum G186AR]
MIVVQYKVLGQTSRPAQNLRVRELIASRIRYRVETKHDLPLPVAAAHPPFNSYPNGGFL